MREIIPFLSVLLISSASFADISAPAVQQALHDAVSVEDGFPEDHVFTCQDRSIVRCDESDNVILLAQYISDENQLNADLGVFSYLRGYRLSAGTNLTTLPAGLENLSTLITVDIIANGFILPVIDGNAFPESLYSLSIYAQQTPVSLINWETHSLAVLSLNGLEADFNFTQFPNLESLSLVNTQSISNENFESFTSVTGFSWQHMYEEDIAAYYTVRAQFPLLSGEVVEINLSRKYGEPKLTEIPAYILDIPNLQSLKITGHAITEIPEQLFSISALKQLDVGSNEIETLPAINEGSNIEELSLRGNKLTQIPEALFELEELRHLDLLGNKISSLPADLFLMSNLQELDARNNMIESLDVTGTITGLQSLMLDGNKLSDIPAELLQLEGLLILELSRNELTVLPEITQSSATLQTLQINRNKIKTLPASILNYLPLQELQARSNELSSLPESIVNSSTEIVNFSGNKFTQVPDELALFTGLKKADFNDNQIETLAEQWKQSVLLEELWLNGNQLTELTSVMLGNLPSSLKLLSLGNNRMVGELPDFTRINPELSVIVSDNALWSTDMNVLQKYAGKNVLQEQLLPVRGIRVIEKNIEGDLVSYIQWGFPLMQDLVGRTPGSHPANFRRSASLDEAFSDVNPGPYLSTGYHLIIEYTQGEKAGKTVTETFSCMFYFLYELCGFDHYSASYDTETYDSSVFSYGVRGSLAGANIAVYSRSNSGLLSSPTYRGSIEEHEQFVDELEYDEAPLPLIDVDGGSLSYYHIVVFLLIALARMRSSKNFLINQ